jgi:hypothetical protein
MCRLPYIYMEYTWYIPTIYLIGVPDVRNLATGTRYIEGFFDIEAFDIEGCFDIEYTTFYIELLALISKLTKTKLISKNIRIKGSTFDIGCIY